MTYKGNYTRNNFPKFTGQITQGRGISVDKTIISYLAFDLHVVDINAGIIGGDSYMNLCSVENKAEDETWLVGSDKQCFSAGNTDTDILSIST